MALSDFIQLVIAAATAVAAIAAWRASKAARNTAYDAEMARKASVHERQIAMLNELLDHVASLRDIPDYDADKGSRYRTGARIRSLLLSLPGYDLPLCAQIGKILGGGALEVAPNSLPPAEKEVTEAITSERQKLAQLTEPPGQASVRVDTR